jgi:amino acid transporter
MNVSMAAMPKNIEMSSSENVASHVSVLSVLYFLIAGIFLFFAILMYVFMNTTGLPFLGMQSFSFSHNAAVVLISFFLLLTFLSVSGAIGMLRWKEWGRKITMALGGILVFALPIGTVVGLYTLWVLTHERARYYFSKNVKEKPKHLG